MKRPASAAGPFCLDLGGMLGGSVVTSLCGVRWSVEAEMSFTLGVGLQAEAIDLLLERDGGGAERFDAGGGGGHLGEVVVAEGVDGVEAGDWTDRLRRPAARRRWRSG